MTTKPHYYTDNGSDKDVKDYPLAVKMMFNYEAESNAPAILRAMCKELLPARCVQLDEEQLEWQERYRSVMLECKKTYTHEQKSVCS